MRKEDPRFFNDRAVAFACLMLTKYRDVRPRAATDDTGIDLIVEIRTKGKSKERRLFGVQLVPFMDLPDVQDADKRVRSLLGKDSLEAALPICVFVIGVRKPDGICRWVVEPVVEDGRALLRREGVTNWQTLDEAGAARLIDQVNAWYDALNGGSPPKSRGRRSKAES